MKKILFASLLAFAVVGVSIAWHLYNKPVATLEEADAEIDIDAKSLFTAFLEDETSASTKYRDKVLMVEGQVIEKLENSDGSTTLLLDGGDPIFGIKCRLDPSVEGLPLPEPGESIRIKGHCIGMNADVELNQCIII